MIAGSVFGGIGGAELGLHWAGIPTAWSIEIDPFRRRVLKQHFKHTRVYSDVRFVDVEYDLGYVDLIVGGFPCQDTSHAGRQEGLDGKRSGLFFNFVDIVRALRPRYVIVENVSGLRRSGMGRALGALAALGYMGQWDCIPASALGAPHERERVWIVAWRNQGPFKPNAVSLQAERVVADPASLAHGRTAATRELPGPPWAGHFTGSSATAGADAGCLKTIDIHPEWIFCRHALERFAALCQPQWQTEPRVDRVVDGLPAVVDESRTRRLRALGDSLVPQMAALLALRIQLHARQ